MPNKYSEEEGVRFFGVDEKFARAFGIPKERLESGRRKLDIIVVIDVKQCLCGPSDDLLHESGIEVDEGTDVVRRKRAVPNNQGSEDIQKSVSGI